MDELTTHLSNIYATDWASLGIICALCVASAYFVKEYMANPVLVVLAFPVLFLFSVLVQYAFILAELYPQRKLDQWLMWTVIATICGNIGGIAVVAGLGRLADSASRPRRQPQRSMLRR